jgi:cyanophycinase-like exopeptidase
VVKDNHVYGAERLCSLAGKALDERLVIEVTGDIQVLGQGAVDLLPAAGEQQTGAFAAEM